MVVGIAAQSAIAIENARLYQERTRTAQTLQRALLPPHLPEIDNVELAATYRAAGEGNEVGGDFYDVFPQADGSFALVVGDVCGKGPQAAAVTALARYTLRAHAVAGLRPSYQLARLNDALLRQHAPGFVTVALARLEPTDSGARVELATAGHPLPIVARRGRDAAGRRRDAARDRRAPGAARGHDRPHPRRPARLLHRRRHRGRRAAPPADRARPGRARRRARGAGPAGRRRAPGAHRGRQRRRRPRDDIACLALRLPAPTLVSERFTATPHAAHDVADALAPVKDLLGPTTAMDIRLLATELVANAVKHTGLADGSVEVELWLEGDIVHLIVSDDGPGLRGARAPAGHARGPGRLGALPRRPVRDPLGERTCRAPPRVAGTGAPRCRLRLASSRSPAR